MASLLVVPSALQASRAARRLCDDGGGLLFGAGVTTLDALVTRLLVAAGERRAILTPLGDRLLAVEAGNAAGGPLAGLRPESGLAGSLTEALSQLRQGEVSATVAREVAGTLQGAAAGRLELLARALAAWEASLARLDLLDQAGALRAAASAVQRGVAIDDGGPLEEFTLDGFTSLTAAEWALVRALAERARSSLFRIPHFAHDPALAGPTVRLMARVESMFDLGGDHQVGIDTGSAEGRSWRQPEPGTASEPLAARPAALLRALGGVRPEARALQAAEPRPDGEVLALAGAGEEGEAALAAQTAARFIQAGIPPSELVVFAPAPRLAASRLAAAFAAEGVPFASGRGAPLGEAPPVGLVLDALSLAAGARDRLTLERLAASSYLGSSGLGPRLGLLLDAAGAMDGRVGPLEALRRRAAQIDPGERPAAPPGQGSSSRDAGPDEPEARRRRERRIRRRDELLGAANRLASLLGSVELLAGPATAATHASRLTSFLDGAGVRRLAGQGEAAVTVRDLAALSTLEEAADGLVRALTTLGRGGERMGTAEWRQLLGLAVDRATLRADREPIAGAVELDAMAEAPGRSARAAILVGCVAGAVPAPVAPEPLLRDAERTAINDRLRRGALSLGAGRRAEAFHQLVCAVAAGRERVAVLWPGAGPSGSGELAPLLAQAILDPGQPHPEPARAPRLGEAHTPRQALLAAAALGRGPEREAALVALEASGLRTRAAQALAVGEIEWARRDAVVGRIRPTTGEATGAPRLERPPSPYAGRLDDAGRAQLATRLPAEWSARHFESLATCPFSLLVELGTGLRDPEEAGLDIDSRDEGRLFHAILERWVRERIERRSWPPSGSRADVAEARQVALSIFAEFERDGAVGDPAVWASRREAVLTRLAALVRAEASAADALAPRLLEHQFGGRSGVPALELRAGGELVRVQGRIDRVDASTDRLRVIDYKNSGNDQRYRDQLKPEAFGVTSFQLPLYLLAAARALPERAPTATYLLLQGAERVEASGEALGLDEAALAGAVVAAVRQVRAGELPIASRDCQHCAYGAICRFKGVADAGREEVLEGAP